MREHVAVNSQGEFVAFICLDIWECTEWALHRALGTVYCTLPRGHDGPHEAVLSEKEEVVIQWPQREQG